MKKTVIIIALMLVLTSCKSEEVKKTEDLIVELIGI